MFESYVKKILTSVDPHLHISATAKKAFSDLISVLIIELLEGSIHGTLHARTRTISSRDVQTAVRHMLKGELSKHAVSAATKAVTWYTSFDMMHRPRRQSGAKRAKPVTASTKAKLTLPVARIEAIWRKHFPDYIGSDRRIGETAPVYAAAVIEYLITEILEVSANVTKEKRKKTIVPAFVEEAIEKDKELKRTFCALEKKPFQAVATQA